MAKNITQYDLLISCPGDVKEEIIIIREVVAQFNEQFSDVLNLSVRTKHWSKNSYPQSGGKPQELLNQQFVKDCDAAVAIFWTRFGTPTDEYGFGTEEEIEIMLDAGKQVFMYFSDMPLAPSQAAAQHEDYQRVQAFRERYKDRGIYYTYSSHDELKKQLLAHLSQHYLSLKPLQEMEQQKTSKLFIKTITGARLGDKLTPIRFEVTSYFSSDKGLDEIEKLFDRIRKYSTHAKENTIESATSLAAAMYKPVEITEEKQKWITTFAEKMGHELGGDFFSLGSLKENMFSGLIPGESRVCQGTEEELGKYNDILELYRKTRAYAGWLPFEKMYGQLSCIRLAVINEGTAFDEDIEITLTFPSDMLILHTDLPIPQEYTLRQIGEDSSLYDVFGIAGTALYYDYESSKRPFQFQPSTPSVPPSIYPFGGGRDYEEEYIDDLDDIFEYKIFDDNGFKIVKLHVDYLKHNTAVAFPSVIFVSEKLSDVPYTITSKHGSAEVSGVLAIG